MLKPHLEYPVAVSAILGLSVVGAWALTRWIQSGPRQPDPWDTQVEDSIQTPEAVPVCRHCFSPQTEHAHFCSECGTSVGDYNNLLPYVYIFSIGEGLRTGSSGKYKLTPLTAVGYLLWSMTEYAIFAPVYWFFLFKNANRISMNKDAAEEPKTEGLL